MLNARSLEWLTAFSRCVFCQTQRGTTARQPAVAASLAAQTRLNSEEDAAADAVAVARSLEREDVLFLRLLHVLLPVLLPVVRPWAPVHIGNFVLDHVA